jgi:Neprosin
MINAAADDTPDTHAAATSAAAGSDADAPDAVAPPTTELPWGGRPHRMKLGRMGSSSAALAAAGASAAKNDNDTEPTPEFGPKGRTFRNGALLKQQTNVQPPPVPPGLAAEPVPGQKDVLYTYGVAKQSAVTSGAAATMTIARPKVEPEDWHSLAEIAVQSADGAQAIEVGWTVDRLINGDDEPHLFVFNWVDNGPKCYNECGFTPAKGASIKPGAALPSGVSRNFGVQHIGDAWWIAYDTEWIGMFPDDNWDGGFTQSGLVQFFGEVAASTTTSCTQMGTGAQPDTAGAARFSSVVYVDGPPVALNVKPNADLYGTARVSDRTFRYGGPKEKDKDGNPTPCAR